KVRAITTEANLENDPVGFFLEKCCYVQEGSRVKSFELYTIYENFSQLEGITTFKIQKFGRIMKDKGYDKERTMDGVLYRDIGIKPEWMANEEYVEFNPPEEAIIEDT
ncbi:MAG TPA: primase-like DNA-binding domain-containing protein, partial [Methanofastidiosum sp.]|nr:primase-like DNA-binding domain-containing protein [Methanofastidiosum sp.]